MKNFGYWVFGRDMDNVNLETFKNNGITDIFLNYYAFEAHGESKVLQWIVVKSYPEESPEPALNINAR